MASTTLSPPVYPLLDVEGRLCQIKKYEDLVQLNPLESVYHGMGEGFEVLACLGLSDRLVNTFTSMGDFSMVLDAYSTGQATNIDMDAILDTRDVVIHTLLSLPLEHEFCMMRPHDVYPSPPGESAGSNTSLHIYQACRWAALLYGILVIFPIPRSKCAREHAVSELQAQLSSLSVSSIGQNFLPLHAWLLVMGGSSSYEREQRKWFQLRLTQVLGALEIETWHEAQKLLKKFAWVPNICDPAALYLWSGVM